MDNKMEYNSFYGTIEFSEEDGCYYGKIEGIESLYSYEANSIEKLKLEFEKAVDEYLEDCK